MTYPKYLNIPREEKQQVNVRLPVSILQKVKQVGEITNKTQSEIIINTLKKAFENRITHNSYLGLLDSELYIKIPQSLILKQAIETPKKYIDAFRGTFSIATDEDGTEILVTNELLKMTEDIVYYKNLIDDLSKKGEFKISNVFSIGLESSEESKRELYGTIKDYEIYTVPNNLDIFNYEKLTYETMFNDGRIGHSGIDYIIIPETANYTDDFTDCLYIFYFKYYDNKLNNSFFKDPLKIYLINYADCLKFLENRNENLKELIKTIYLELSKAKNLEDVQELADTFPAYNIKKLTDSKPDKKPELTNIQDGYTNQINNYSYKAMNKKIEDLEEENKALNEKIDNIESEFNKRIDETITNVLKKYNF